MLAIACGGGLAQPAAAQRHERELRIACAASDSGLLRYVPRAARCARRSEQAIVLAEQAPIDACVSPALTFASSRRGGRRIVIPRGTIWRAPSIPYCARLRQRGVVLGGGKPVHVCAMRRDGLLRYTGRSGACTEREIELIVAARSAHHGTPPPKRDKAVRPPEAAAVPVAEAQAVSTSEGRPVSIVLAGHLVNSGKGVVSGPVLGFAIASTPAHGTLSGIPPFVTYTPAPGFHGSDSFTFTADLGIRASAPATVSIAVAHVNHAPVLSLPGEQVINENTTLTFSSAGADAISAGDEDSEGGVERLTLEAAHGSLKLGSTASLASVEGQGGGKVVATGTIAALAEALELVSYAPAAGYKGSDSLKLEADDLGHSGVGGAKTAAGSVPISVLTVVYDKATDDSYATEENETLEVSAPGVLANDTDSEALPLSAEVVESPEHGSLSVNADGSFEYTPDHNYAGSDSFSYRDQDGNTPSNVATVALTVNKVVYDTAVGDSYSTHEGTKLEVAAPGVLTNDKDSDSPPLPLGAVLVSGPAHGTLSLNQDGSFSYTPAAGYHGSDSFTYKDEDGNSASNVATVTLTVEQVDRQPSVEVPGAQSTAENTSLTFSSAGADAVLVEDGDSEGGSEQVTLAVAHGTLTLGSTSELEVTGNASASVTLKGPIAALNAGLEGLVYEPAHNYHGADSLDVEIDDLGHTGVGGPLTASGSVAITVTTAVFDKAVDDSYATEENETLEVSAPGVLANDTDSEALPLSAEVVKAPEHGSLTLNADGSFEYAPDHNYSGSDSFSYRDQDTNSPSNVATVSITVEKATFDKANDDSYTVDEGETLSVTAGEGVLANDTDSDSPPLPLKPVLVSGPAHGALSFNEDGSFTYEPQAGFAGSDSFTYADEDGNTQSNTATVTIEVDHLDRAPETTLPGSQTVASGEALTFSSAGSNQISVADSDSEGEAEKLTLKAAHGTLVPATTAGLTAHTGEGTGTLTLEGPIAALDEALEGLTYTAEASYGGADALTVEINDLGHSGIGGPKTAGGTVEITVLHTDQAPTLNGPASAETKESAASAETSIVFSKAAGDEITYADGDSGGGSEQLVLTAEHGALTPGSASGLTATGSGTGSLTLEGSVAAIGEGLEGLTYKPELDYSGADTLALKASDLGHSGTGGPKTASASIAITIAHPNPTATSPTYSGAIGNTELSVGVSSGGAPDVEQSGSVLSETTEPDGSAVHVTAATISTEHGGSVSMKEDGTFTYEPPVGFDNGTDKFTYTEADTRGGKASGTVTIKVDNARVWYVNDNNGSDGNGESNSPFNVLSAVTGASNPTSTGDVIFLYGGATSYTGGIALKSSQTLDGQSEGLTVEGHKLVNASGENPTLTNSAGAGVQLAEGDAVKGVTVSGTSGAGVLATGIGGFTLDSKVLISGTAGTGLEVSGGSGTVTDEATINTSSAHSLSIASRTGGTFTASGPITDGGTGISLSSNTGATIDLTGKLSLSTATHTAFSATGGGTIAATGSENTSATTTGTALSVQNTTISSSGLKFRSISAGSATGPTNGVLLENTGTSGGLTVTGTGVAGSGGTIEHTIGAAIALKTTADTSLNEMTISTPSHSGIQGSGVDNFQFTNGTIAKAGAAKTTSSDAAIAFNETSGAQNDNVEGTVTITGDTFTEPYGSGLDISNYKGTIADLDVSNDTISSSTSESTSKGEGISLHLLGSTTTIASLTKAEIEKDTITNFPSGSGIDLQGGNTQSSTAPSGTYGNPGSATEVVKIDANEVHGSATVQCTPGTSGCLAHDAINAEVLGRGKGNFQIVGNGSESHPLGESIGTTIGVLFAGNVTGEAAIKNNTIAAENSAGSQAIGVGEDKNTQADSSVASSPSAKVTISSNKITKSDKAGIFVLQRDSNGTLDLKLDENTIGAPLEAASGIEVSAGSAGSASFNPTLCSEIKGNATTIGPTEAFGEALPGITLLKESTSSSTYVFGITGLTPSPATAEQTESYLAGQNPSANLGSGEFYGSHRVFVAEGSQFTSCALPTMP